MVVRRNNRVGIIRVLTTDDKSLLHRHGRILEGAFPALAFDSRCIPDQPEGIHDAETERMASPKVAALAREMVCEGVGGILVSCAGDPAVLRAACGQVGRKGPEARLNSRDPPVERFVAWHDGGGGE